MVMHRNFFVFIFPQFVAEGFRLYARNYGIDVKRALQHLHTQLGAGSI